MLQQKKVDNRRRTEAKSLADQKRAASASRVPSIAAEIRIYLYKALAIGPAVSRTKKSSLLAVARDTPEIKP
jgi:hypothetical protein